MVALVILDGWGLSPNWRGNAISLANPPTMDRLWREYPHTVLQAYQPQHSSLASRVGTSDIGHAMLGAGRQLRSDLEEILEAIDKDVFHKNPTLLDAFAAAKQHDRAVHLIGMISDGAIHSDPHVLEALVDMAQASSVTRVYLHLITDGHDVAPRSAGHYIDYVKRLLAQRQIGSIASLVGRYYAMDRDQHWDRTRVAYDLWTRGKGTLITSPEEALERAYRQGIPDAGLPPAILDNQAIIRDGDVAIVWNNRADRLRQLVRAFVDPSAFRPFLRRQAPLRRLAKFVSLVSPQLKLEGLDVAFPPAQLRSTLAEILSGRGLSQLRAAESEKAGHVTYMFNGGREILPGEEHLIVPTPAQKEPGSNPGSATPRLVEEVIKRIKKKPYDFILINIANVDLTAHSGNVVATAKAIQVADRAIRELAETILAKGGTLLITADHGNAEQMLYSKGYHSRRAHTVSPVPCILVQAERERNLVRQATVSKPSFLANIINTTATLADISPTILEILEIPVPVEMTGRSLLSRLE